MYFCAEEKIAVTCLHSFRVILPSHDKVRVLLISRITYKVRYNRHILIISACTMANNRVFASECYMSAIWKVSGGGGGGREDGKIGVRTATQSE